MSEPRYCIFCNKFFYWLRGQGKGKYCSILCACRSRNTVEHQQKAGKAGGETKIQSTRGTGKKGYIKEYGRHQHRIVIEKAIGRKLKSNEIVHHKDGNKHNNRLKNLKILTRAEHMKIHLHAKRLKRGKKIVSISGKRY